MVTLGEEDDVSILTINATETIYMIVCKSRELLVTERSDTVASETKYAES